MEAQLETPAIEDVQIVETKPKELTEDQKALKVFENAMNDVVYKVNNYHGSKKQLQRVIINSLLYPLNKEEFEFSYPEEKELFELLTSVGAAKFYLMVSGLVAQNKLVWVEEVSQPLEEKKDENVSS